MGNSLVYFSRAVIPTLTSYIANWDLPEMMTNFSKHDWVNPVEMEKLGHYMYRLALRTIVKP